MPKANALASSALIKEPGKVPCEMPCEQEHVLLSAGETERSKERYRNPKPSSEHPAARTGSRQSEQKGTIGDNVPTIPVAAGHYPKDNDCSGFHS